MEDADEGDAGERGAEAGGELGDAEEVEEEGGDPELSGGFSSQGWAFQWGMSQRPGASRGRCLGVDAFVPVGEAVVAEQGQQDDGGEEVASAVEWRAGVERVVRGVDSAAMTKRTRVRGGGEKSGDRLGE